MTTDLTMQEKEQLLEIAREAIGRALRGEGSPPLDPGEYSDRLQAPGASFVTLTEGGELRGCVGSIQASRPLVLDVHDRALAAAFEDPRFPPLSLRELDEIEIEVSVLTQPERLDYHDPAELTARLRPGVDGVILTHQYRRATFLPQVWEKLPVPEQFLGRLCQKMGMPPESWKVYPMEVETYQVEMFSEGDLTG